jgi:hypothetical protein
MENGVYFPVGRQRQFVIDFSYHFHYLERSFPSGFQFGVNLHFEVPCVQPYVLSKFEWSIMSVETLTDAVSSDFMSL